MREQAGLRPEALHLLLLALLLSFLHSQLLPLQAQPPPR